MNTRTAVVATGLFTSLALVLAAAAHPQAKGGPDPSGGYEVDPVHSSVLFKVRHLNTSWTFGRFDKIGGNLTLNAASPEKSSVTMTIAAESIDTGTKQRDDHLRSSSFLDAAQFPDITFTSKSVKKSGEGKYSVEGDLALHGVKKPLTAELEQVGYSDTPKTGVRTGFLTTFTVKRSDFGMNFMPEAVGDEVHMTVSVEAAQTEAKKK